MYSKHVTSQTAVINITYFLSILFDKYLKSKIDPRINAGMRNISENITIN